MPSLEPMVVRTFLSASSPRHTEKRLFMNVAGGGLAEGGHAFIEGIAVILGVVDGLGHFIDDEFVGGEVGVPDA